MSAPAPVVRAAGAAPLAGFYALYFATTGIILPFLPAWFKALGVPESRIGALLAIQPALSLFAPLLWGHLADRSGRPDRVLSVVAFGAAAGFSLLLWARGFVSLALAMAAYAFFASGITTLADSLTLQRVSLHGGSYGRIRLFGSLGFVLSSSLFGLFVAEVDRRAVAAPLVLMSAYFLCSLTVRARAATVPHQHPLTGVALLRHRDLALMLAACALHWIACAPFHGTFGIHVLDIGLPPWVIGVSAGLGVLAEVAVMFAHPRVARRLAPRHLLFIAFVGSAVRWLGMAVADSAAAIVALSLLHGITFGAFYVAAVAFLAARVPDTLRASGQALMVAVTFGLGGLWGYLGAGAGYEALGGHRLFAVAGVLELLPALLILLVRPPERTGARAG